MKRSKSEQSYFTRLEASRKRLGMVFRFLERASSAAAVRSAEFLFLRPLPRSLRKEERAILKEGSRLTLHGKKGRLRGHRWGSGPPILMVHGWASRAARFFDLVRALQSSGYSVVAFDLPAHGDSSGLLTTLPECIEALQLIHDTYGPFQAVVGHSFGALCAASFLEETKGAAEQLVVISPLRAARVAVESFGELSGIPTTVLDKMQTRLEQRHEYPFSRYDFFRLGKVLTTPILVIHDREDRISPFAATEEWTRSAHSAELMATDGLGHQRILSDEKVVDRILQFLGEPRGDVRSQLFSEYAL